MFKFTDKENENLVDLNTNKSFRKDSQYYFKRVIPWLDEGNIIEPFETAEEISFREHLEREQRRDDLMNRDPVILHKGNYYLMDNATMNLLSNSRGALSRGKQLDFKVQDAITGEKKRVKLGIVELEKFEDALTDALNTIHVQTDTQEPVNPWPLEVE